MDDYEDLVKRLRNRRICIQQSGSLNDFPMLVEAADAIEQILEERDSYRKAMTKEHNRAARLWWEKEHPWKLASMCLPEFEGAVLCMRKSNVYGVRPYQEILYVDEFGFKNFDDIYLADGVVTHWTMLPQPPKEEQV